MQKKILIIIPNLGRGGAQQIFRQQVKFLSSFHNVTGCVFNWEGSFKEDRSNNIISLEVPAGKNVFQKVRYFIQRISRLNKIKKTYKIDVAISHLEGADYVNVFSRAGEKTICWLHGSKKHDQNISGIVGLLRAQLLMPWIYRKADRIVTVSRGIKQELINSISGIEGRTQVIYNGFQSDSILSLSEEQLDSDHQLVFKNEIIVTHCRLSRQKNLRALVKVFYGLRKRYPAKLAIIGDGELRQELLTLCKELSLKAWTIWSGRPMDEASDVYFMGHQTNPFKFLRHSRIYVMTSDWEGFPLALCEAMVCGLPVVATDCFTGPREIISPELKENQPVSVAHYTAHGMLMPLVDESDEHAISYWALELENVLQAEQFNSFKEGSGKERIKQFELSESMNQTVNLVRQITNE
jgi:glycosyltransferase involved in cell wall biosynthesis